MPVIIVWFGRQTIISLVTLWGFAAKVARQTAVSIGMSNPAVFQKQSHAPTTHYPDSRLFYCARTSHFLLRYG
jgi:hypothetical protein